MRNRAPNFKFNDIKKHWHTTPFKTHLLNGFTLIFPPGEKFFIRTIRRYLKQLPEPLKSQAKVFVKQEAQHLKEHERFYRNLQSQGYNIRLIHYILNALTDKVLDPMFGPRLNLAITAGLEHYTAVLSEVNLKTKFMAGAQEEMARLFNWHSIEEIEHKHVAYDVLQEIDDSYLLRIVGFILATVILGCYLSICTSYFLHKDRELLTKETIRDLLKIWITDQKLLKELCNQIYRYLQINFHPNDENTFKDIALAFFA